MLKNTTSNLSTFTIFHAPTDIADVQMVDGIRTEVSRPFLTSFHFSSLVISANFHTPTDGCLMIEVQVYSAGKWSEFYKMGMLSRKFKSSFPEQKDDFARVCVDELLLNTSAEGYRFRLKFYGEVSLQLLTVTGVRQPFNYKEKQACRLPEADFCRDVIPLSQMEQDHPERRRICSPVALTMALKTLGYPADLSEVLPNVFDQHADIYGNWVFNVAVAADYGAQAWVQRFRSLEELKDFITPDCVVLASIAYQKGELSNAPLEKTAGHLVLVRGWKKGKVLVADPAAADSSTVLREYNANEFAAAWLNNKRGIAYVVRKK